MPEAQQPSFLQFLLDALQQRTLRPEPTVQTGAGLRPQSDLAVQLLTRALRGDGMGINAQPLQPLGVNPQSIVQSALRTPGTLPVYTGRPQQHQRGLAGMLKSPIGGLHGQTGVERPTQVDIYPQNNPERDTNIMLHELIHAMRVQRGLNDPKLTTAPAGTPPSTRGLEESLAYHGTGSPGAFGYGPEQVPPSRQAEVEQLLRSLMEPGQPENMAQESAPGTVR